jgi:hypothetical protein
MARVGSAAAPDGSPATGSKILVLGLPAARETEVLGKWHEAAKTAAKPSDGR